MRHYRASIEQDVYKDVPLALLPPTKAAEALACLECFLPAYGRTDREMFFCLEFREFLNFLTLKEIKILASLLARETIFQIQEVLCLSTDAIRACVRSMEAKAKSYGYVIGRRRLKPWDASSALNSSRHALLFSFERMIKRGYAWRPTFEGGFLSYEMIRADKTNSPRRKRRKQRYPTVPPYAIRSAGRGKE